MIVLKPMLDMVEFGDGFTIRVGPVHAKRDFLNLADCGQYLHVAHLRKADGWTRETAGEVLRLYQLIHGAVVQHTVMFDE